MMTQFTILQHRDFVRGTDLGYGFGGLKDDPEGRWAAILNDILNGSYRLAGEVEAEGIEDAWMAANAPGWAPMARSASVGDVFIARGANGLIESVSICAAVGFDAIHHIAALMIARVALANGAPAR